MKANLGRIAEWVGGRLCEVDEDTPVRRVVTDSRKHLEGPALFIALEGPNFDGHAFVDSVRERGAVAALVASGRGVAGPRIEVDDTLEALQALAAAWRSRFTGEVIGITGSNGKTIVKEMLAAILSRTRRVARSPGSYNSQVGVALSLLEIDCHDVVIIEAGISEIGEMSRLEAMIRPTCGAVTTIGKAHFDGLGRDLAMTAREKTVLFRRCSGPVVIPGDNEWLDPASFEQPVVFHVEHSPDCDAYQVDSIEQRGNETDFVLHTPSGEAIDITLATPGRYNVSNATAAAILALELGALPRDIQRGLAAFETSPMRLDMHTTRSGVTILNDAYVSDPTSARTAIEELEFYGTNHRKVAILGDMRELGELADEAHRELGRFVATSSVDRLVAVGGRAHLIVEGAHAAGMPQEDATARPTLDGLAVELEEWLEPGDFVLFKGSRAVGLERVAAGLVESVAPERLEVDLDAIRSNVHALRKAVGDAGLMAVVKSFAYGNDATRVSQTLVREGVSWLAVAYPDEAIPLRGRGIDVPILVTNVLPDEADKFAKYELTALVSSTAMVDALARAARDRGTEVALHIEVDTGMSRMGVLPGRVVALADHVRQTDGVWLEGVMTHFAAADVHDEDDFTRQQISEFDETRAALRAAGHDLVAHAANTAAAWRFPESQYDFVRVGLGLYGVSPSSDVSSVAELTPALRFTSRVLQVRTLEEGRTVGYGRTWRAARPSRIATVAIGYNDGFPRFMSNGGEVLIRGVRCPVVGTVCMDATMVDVTDLPEVSDGDEVVLFGNQGDASICVDEIAQRGDTISYEILTGISPRVRRIFRRYER
jgi:alanine racemase